MDGIFSLPYSEYEAIAQIQKHFKKKDGVSVFIPTSRQQKGIDFILLNTQTSKVLRFQVKASRSWTSSNPKKKKHTLFFYNFIGRYAPGVADIYVLFGLYPIYATSSSIKTKRKLWSSVVLIFTDREMGRFLASVRKVKSPSEPDPFFYIGFDDESEVRVTRGIKNQPAITKHLLAMRIADLKKRLV